MKVPVLVVTSCLAAAGLASAQPLEVIDLATITPQSGVYKRVHGASGNGQYGVPVAAGHDVDGDGRGDVAVSFMTASPLGRTRAGEVDLVFGNGQVRGTVDTAVAQAGVLRILGDQTFETAGSEIWIDDVTGDGLGDLLICRQNFNPGVGRSGAGALTIVAGGAALKTFAAGLQPLDLRSPPMGLTLTHVVGIQQGGRFCIWVRTGDIDGDGTSEVVVGADQETTGSDLHSGSVWVLRGGALLGSGGTLDLLQRATPPLAGQVVRIVPPENLNTSHYHFGATCQVADLDGDGKGEVLAAATLNRAGASLPPAGGPTPDAIGGALHGLFYVVWDDNFTLPWPDVFRISLEMPPGSVTSIRGGATGLHFGEEILGGLDYDGDGQADLFVGDITGDATPLQDRSASGAGYVFYDAAGLLGLDFDLDTVPGSVAVTTILGPSVGALGGDTATHGDVDGDGKDDLTFCSPHAAPAGRANAGMVHVLRGRTGGWPATIDTAALPPRAVAEVTEVHGAKAGDVLCYSAAAGDVDGDGTTDLVLNEMLGEGTQTANVGNLLVVRGTEVFAIFTDGFESGNLQAWSASVP